MKAPDVYGEMLVEEQKQADKASLNSVNKDTIKIIKELDGRFEENFLAELLNTITEKVSLMIYIPLVTSEHSANFFLLFRHQAQTLEPPSFFKRCFTRLYVGLHSFSLRNSLGSH